MLRSHAISAMANRMKINLLSYKTDTHTENPTAVLCTASRGDLSASQPEDAANLVQLFAITKILPQAATAYSSRINTR